MKTKPFSSRWWADMKLKTEDLDIIRYCDDRATRAFFNEKHKINEPSVEEMKEILKGVSKENEEFRKKVITGRIPYTS